MVDYGEAPSAFLESFPTYRLHSKPRSHFNGLWVFSSKNEGYESNSYSSDDVGTRTIIYEQIKSAFSKIDTDFYGLIAQFWAPVTIGGKHFLSTSGQPFAVSLLDEDFIKYRKHCVEHVYDIDVNSKFRGTPASAFLNRFTEVASMDPSVHHEVDPLLRHAYQECSLMTSLMIPIRCPSQTSSSSDCIGVMCSTWRHSPVNFFNEMNMKIKEVGLSVYNIQDRIPYKTINGLKLARDQIQEALKIVCQSHQITLAQVWIASLDENHVDFSSSLEEAQTRRLLGLKLTGYKNIDEDTIDEDTIDEDSIDENNEERCFFQNYYDACDLIPLQPGEEFILKTLQDFEPRFCKNISKLGIYKLMGLDWCGGTDKSMGLTICMRSIHTGDFNYVFEFLWTHDSFNPILLEEILLNIKRCLPNFKFASGTEIGDKLHVIEVDNSTDKEIKKFDIFQSKRLSPIPEALKDGNKQVAVNYITPLDTNCKTAPVLLPQQVIEQQFGTSTTEDFLELGDQLQVIDVDSSTESETQFFKISKEKRLSPIPEAIDKGKKAMVVNYNTRSKRKRDTTKKNLSREEIERHYGKTMKEAAKELGVSVSTLKRWHNNLCKSGWQGPDLLQRKAYNSNKNQSKESHTHEKNNGVIQDPSPVKKNENTVFKAEYADDKIILHLPISEATFVTVKNEIGERFKLEDGTFKIKFLDKDEEWILMDSDQDLSYCIQNSRNVDRSAFQLRVLLHNQ